MLRLVGWRTVPKFAFNHNFQKPLFRTFCTRNYNYDANYRDPSWFDSEAKNKERNSMRKVIHVNCITNHQEPF